MALIEDLKERTTPLVGSELVLIEDDEGLRGVHQVELLKAIGPQCPPVIGGSRQSSIIPINEQVTLDENMQLIVYRKIRIDGTLKLTINAALVIL